MATRSGNVDPGLLLWLMEKTGMAERELGRRARARIRASRARGQRRHVREVLERATGGDGAAGLALEVYVHRLRCAIAAMAAAMGGVDVLALTAGVGESSPEIRDRTTAGLGFLGIVIDQLRNSAATGDVEITGAGAAARTCVVHAREDLEIARQAGAVVSERPDG